MHPPNYVSLLWVTPLGRVFKIHDFSHAILCQINGISRASLTPLGRVFKFHDFFLHGFDDISML